MKRIFKIVSIMLLLFVLASCGKTGSIKKENINYRSIEEASEEVQGLFHEVKYSSFNGIRNMFDDSETPTYKHDYLDILEKLNINFYGDGYSEEGMVEGHEIRIEYSSNFSSNNREICTEDGIFFYPLGLIEGYETIDNKKVYRDVVNGEFIITIIIDDLYKGEIIENGNLSFTMDLIEKDSLLTNFYSYDDVLCKKSGYKTKDNFYLKGKIIRVNDNSIEINSDDIGYVEIINPKCNVGKLEEGKIIKVYGKIAYIDDDMAMVDCSVVEMVDSNVVPLELSTEPIKVEFWHAMGITNQAIIAKVIDNFEREYQSQGYNIKVIQMSMGDNTSLRDKIVTSIAVNQQPTIAQTNFDAISLYLSRGGIQKLDKYNKTKWGLTKNEIDNYFPKFYDDGKIYDEAGTLYSLPFTKSTEVLYYNKTIFEKYGWKVPTTWEGIVDVSRKFKDTDEYKDLQNKDLRTVGFSYDSDYNLFVTLTKQWGGECLGHTNSNDHGVLVGDGYALFDNPESKAAIKFYYDNFKAGYLATNEKFGVENSLDAFKNGQCIMVIGGSESASLYNSYNNSFEVGVTTYPQKANTSEKYAVQQGTNVSLFKCDDPQVELAGWLFLKYLTSDESAKIWFKGFDSYTNLAGEKIEAEVGTSYIPIKKSILLSYSYQNYLKGNNIGLNGIVTFSPTLQNKASAIAFEQLEWCYENVAFKNSYMIYWEVCSLIHDVLYESNITENNARINKVYENAIKNLQ